MALDPNTLTEPDSIRQLLANAERLGRDDVANQCRRRLFELEGTNVLDPVEKRLWQAVGAYEQTPFKNMAGIKKRATHAEKLRTRGLSRL